MTRAHQTRLTAARPPLLVAVDFSECSRSALLYAGRLVEGNGTPLLLPHVIHDDVKNPGLYRNPDGRHMTRPITSIAADMLERTLLEIHEPEPGLLALQTARTLLIPGLPGRRIVEIAGSEQAAMIIMGTHGRNGFAHLLQGSVAEYVNKHSRVPAMTVKDDTILPVSLNLDTLDTAAATGVI